MLRRITASLSILLSTLVTASAADKLTFDDHILPIFENYCLECHNQDESRGGLDLSTYGATIAGGSGGEILNPGRADESKVFLVTAKIEGEPMPPRGQGLNKEELDVLKNWITGGVLENVNSTPKKPKENKLTMSADVASLGKPDGPPPMPEHLLLEPVVVTQRAAATSAIATSPWAPLAAVAGQKQILLYHTDNHRLVGILPFPEGHIESLNFSRNSQLLLAGGGVPGKNGRVVAFDVKTGKRQLELGREFDTILSADISADQAFVAFGSPGKLVKILETATGEEAAVIKKHTDWVTAVRYSPDGKKLATGDRQGNLYVWEGDTGNILHELRGHKGPINAIEWRADSHILAAASGDGFAILWEMKEGKQVKRFEAHKEGILDLDFHRDTTLATVGRDKRAKLWNAEGKLLGQTEPISEEPLAIRFRHDGKQLIVGDWTGGLGLWPRELKTKSGSLVANPPSIASRLQWNNDHLKKLTASLESSKAAHKTATTAAEAAAQAKTKVDNQLNAKREELKQLTARLEKTKQEKKPVPEDLPKQIEAAKAKIPELEKQLATAQKNIPVKTKARDEAAGKVGTLEKQIAGTRSTLRYWQAAHANLQHHQLAETLTPLEEAEAKARAELTTAEKAHSQVIAKFKAAEKSREEARRSLEGERNALEKTKASLPEQEKKIRMTRLVLSQQREAEKLLRQQTEESPNDSAPAIAQQFRDALTKSVNAVKSSEKVLANQIHHLNNCVSEARKIVAAAEKNLKAAEQNLHDATEAQKKSSATLAKTKQSHATAAAALAKKKNEAAELKKRYLALRS